jgi:hypothetical protein
MNNFRQKFRASISEKLPVFLSSDGDIDTNLANLYGDPSILEKRCADSIDRFDMPSASSPSRAELFKKHVGSKSPESVIEGLPAEYFQAQFDPLEHNLIELSTWEDLDKVSGKLRLTDRMEEADTDKDVIIAHLTTMIEANYDDLMGCIRNVKAIGDDLCRAEVEVINGRMKIRSFCEIIENGPIHITNLQRKREKLQEIADTIKSLKALKDIHKAMVNNMTTGEIGKSADFAKSVLECLRNDSYDKFHSVGTIGESMQKSIYLIRQKADKALKRLCCRKFASSEYENIVKSYLILDYLNETFGVELSNADDQDFYIDSFPCIEGISQRINRYQLEDTDACLHTAVMEYIYASQHKKQKAEAEWSINLGGMNNLDLVDMTEVPLNMLYRRLATDQAAPCVVRACELLADSIHTHFLITQWHLSPFNANNNDMEYLHRTTIDHITIQEKKCKSPHSKKVNKSKQLLRDVLDFGDDDENLHEADRVTKLLRRSIEKSLDVHFDSSYDEEEDEEQEHEEGGGYMNGFVRSHPLDSYTEKLIEAFVQLRESRKFLWDEVLRSLVEMLNLTNLTSAVKPDDYLAMVWALNSMIKLGKEFCDSDSLPLKMCLDEKSKEYFQNFHLESFQIIRSMVEAEAWHAFPINLAEHGGIVGIIKQNVSRDADISDLSDGQSVDPAIQTTATAAKSPPIGSRRRASINFQNPNQKIQSLDAVPVLPSSSPSSSQPLDGSGVSSGGAIAGGSNGGGDTSILSLFVKGNPFHFMTSNTTPGEGGAAAVEGAPGTTTTTTITHSVTNSIAAGSSSTTTTSSFTSTTSSNVSRSSASSSRSSRSSHSSDSSSSNNDLVSGPKKTGGFWALLADDSDGKGHPMATPTKSKDDTNTSMVVTQVAFNGLSKYVSKYLHMMYLVPAVAPEIFSCLCQLFDYYLLSVFHGFIPLEEKNKFLSKPTKMTTPAPDQTLDYEGLHTYIENTLNEVVTIRILTKHQPSGNGFGSSRTTSTDEGNGDRLSSSTGTTGDSPSPTSQSAHSAHSAHALSFATATSDVKSLLSSNNTYESCTFAKLMRVPVGIEECDATTHFALNDRIVAAESCWFVATILAEIKGKILKLLPDRGHGACESYIEQLQVVAGQLRALVYKSMCPQLVQHSITLPQITDNCGWDSKKLRDSHHDWVDNLVTSCKEVWLYIVSTDSCFADSSLLVREQVWLELCQSAFDVVLEGYSRVRKCSGEGRAAMTMDLNTLHQQLNLVHLCRPPRGKHHIGNYLRCSQMSDEDLIAWIHDNYQSFAYRHTLGLLVQTMQSSVLNNKKLKDATNLIDTLYEVNPKVEKGLVAKRTSMFSRGPSIAASPMAGADKKYYPDKERDSEMGSAKKLSNLLPQSFRRSAQS